MSEEYAYHEDTINNKYTFIFNHESLAEYSLVDVTVRSFKPLEQYTQDDVNLLSQSLAFFKVTSNCDTNEFVHKQLYYIEDFGYINPVIPFDAKNMRIVEVHGVLNAVNACPSSGLKRTFDIINNFSITKTGEQSSIELGADGKFTTYNDTFSYFKNIYLPMASICYTMLSVTNASSFRYDGYILQNGERVLSQRTIQQQINDDTTFIVSNGCAAINNIEYTHPMDIAFADVLVKSAL